VVGHYGLRAAVVAGESTVLGIARLLGFSAISRPGFTALADTDLKGKIEAAREALQGHDLVFLHIKAPDVAAHDHRPDQKRELFERLDRLLEPLLRENLVLAVTGDHSTDSNSGRHTGDPVPSLLYAPQGRVDCGQCFDEGSCLSGGLQRISAQGLVLSMLDAMGCVPQFRQWDHRVLFPL